LAGEKEAVENSTFERVVNYFLGHEKPKDEPKPKAKKSAASTRKKPSTKPKKRES
jgi:hypothetical protein